MDQSAPGSGSQNFGVERVLWLYSLVLGCTTLGAWVSYWLHPKVFTRYPLFSPHDRYRDLTNYLGKIAHLNEGAAPLARGLPVFNYPAPAAFVYKLLLLSPTHPLLPYMSLLAAAIIAFVVISWRAAHIHLPRNSGAAAAILATAAFGMPMHFTIDRANIEGVVWICSAIGLCCLLTRRYWSAAAFIGLASSIKPFPSLLLLLLLAQRRFRETAMGAAVAAAAILLALTALGPNPLQAYKDLLPGIQRYYHSYVEHQVPSGEARFGHSLLDGERSVALLIQNRSLDATRLEETQDELHATPGPTAAILGPLHWYGPVSAAGLLAICLVFFRRPVLNQLAAISVAVTLLPLSASEYTLLYLYVPFAAFVIFLVRDVDTGDVPFSNRAALAIACTYALLLAPLSFFKSLAGDVQLLLLFVLLFLAARYPMHSRFFGADPREPLRA